MGYLELLRAHPHFRRLWLADVASLFGDWLNTLAIYALVRSITDSPAALGLVFIAKLAPNVFASPFAGLLVDRFDRRRLMIVADLLRAAIVACFLLLDAGSWVGWVYLLAVAQVAVSAVFQPARSAATPNVVPPEALATANALGAITWSTILAVGAGIGGVLVDLLGTRAVFLIDAGTYLVSALLIGRSVIPQSTVRAAAREGAVAAVLRGIGDGVRYMRVHPAVGRIACAKAAWGLAGGAFQYLYVLVAPTIYPAAPSTAIGLVYVAAGLGTGIGPVLARNLLPERLWPRALGLVMTAGGCVYVAFGLLPWVLPSLLLLTVAASAGGANWVMSTVLLQQRTEDRFRGRVFANEMLVLTLCNAAAIATASLLLEAGLGVRDAFVSFAVAEVAIGVCFALWLSGERAPVRVPADRAPDQPMR
jgi:MFS family permease